MTPGGASQRAAELVKSYFENQTNVHWAQDSHADTGKAMAEMMIAMHRALADYFEKRD